jgi:hypothetical protein
MKQRIIAAVIVVVCVLAVVAVYWTGPSAKPSADRCPIHPDTTVVVYGGSLIGHSGGSQDWQIGGVDPLSLGWIMNFLDWWHSYDPAVKAAFLNSTNLKSDCNLADYPNVILFIQPGGDAYGQQSSLGPSGKANILAFLDKGGAYVGICAGWYYAAKDYYWAGDYYNWPDLLGRVQTVEGSITQIAEYPAYNMTRMSNGLDMIYYGGPTRGWKQTPNDVSGSVLMTFASIPGHLPAALRINKMLLLAVHPEAYENYGIQGLATDQRISNYKWFAKAINNITGTQFTVPQTTGINPYGTSEQGRGPRPNLSDVETNKGLTFRFQLLSLADLPRSAGLQASLFAMSRR